LRGDDGRAAAVSERLDNTSAPPPPRFEAPKPEPVPPGTGAADADGPARRPPISGSAKLVLIIVGVVLGLCTIIGGAVLLISVASDTSSNSTTYLLQDDEEQGVRGLSAMIFQLGQEGNAEAFVALAKGDSHADPQELRNQFQRVFGGTRPIDYALKEDTVQVLVDTQTNERIVVVRLGISAESSNLDSGPLYMIERDGQWRLTGLSGRQLKEQTQ